MARRKSQPRKQEDIFTGTNKLATTAIKAYKVGGMALVLVIVGLIGLVFTFLFNSIPGTIISVFLFILGVYIYLKENNII